MSVKSIPAIGDVIKWRGVSGEHLSEVMGYGIAHHPKTHEEYRRYIVYVFDENNGSGFWDDIHLEPSYVTQIYRKEVL